VIAFDGEGIVDQEFVPPNHVVNHHLLGEFATPEVASLPEVSTVTVELCVVVVHDIAPAYTALSVWQFLATKTWLGHQYVAAVIHPTSSPHWPLVI
jgi:hypothetical protein